MKKIATIVIFSIAISCFGQGLTMQSVSLFSDTTLKGTTDWYKYWFNVTGASLYGGGELMSLITAKEEDELKEATSTTGSIGLNYITHRLACDLFYSYNGRKVIIMNSLSRFGNTLMNPDLSGQSFSFSILGKATNWLGGLASVQIADNLFQMDSVTTIAAAPLIFRIGFCIRPFIINMRSKENVSNSFDFTVNFNYTHRSFLGDFNNETQIIEGQVITPRGYNGIDISANFYLNYVQLIFQFSQNSKGEFKIPGFTGTQIAFGINVTGDFIKLK